MAVSIIYFKQCNSFLARLEWKEICPAFLVKLNFDNLSVYFYFKKEYIPKPFNGQSPRKWKRRKTNKIEMGVEFESFINISIIKKFIFAPK